MRDRLHKGFRLFSAVLSVAWACRPGEAQEAAPSAVEAHVEEGRVVVLKAPGLAVFRGGFSATVVCDGLTNALSSDSGEVVEARSGLSEQTPYGPAIVSRSTIRFEKERVELLFRLETVEGAPAVLLQAGVRNLSDRPVRLLTVSPLAMSGPERAGHAGRAGDGFRVEGSPADWVVTGLNNATPVVTTLDALKADSFLRRRTPLPITKKTAPEGSLEVFEYGGCYRGDGVGFLFGPAGEPVAYIAAFFRSLEPGRTALTLLADMSGVLIAPGETRWGQQVAFFLEKPGAALTRWDAWVAKTHGAQTAQGALSGWCSWYFLKTNTTGQAVLAAAAQTSRSDGRLRPAVIQIDHGYEKKEYSGILETNEKFPEDLTFYAEKIAATGARPGLKLQPPKAVAAASVAETAGRVARMGYTYLKLGQFNLAKGDGGRLTAFERDRDCYAQVRKAAGDSVYILQNDWMQARAGLGFADACRSGYEAERFGVRPIMEEALRAFHLNGRWFAVDNDVYYMATELKDVSPVVGGWPVARTWLSMVGLSCGAAFTSDPWNEERFKSYWRNVEVLTPPAKERTEVLDLCTSREWPRLVGHVKREWGNWTVALLWNPADKEQEVKLDFARIGLDAHRRYAVWSFWDNRYLGVVEGSYTTPFLGPAFSQHLCFTALPKDAYAPTLIGSSLHIYCGAAELKRVTVLPSAMQIELTDAGARDGDLFIYSRFRPVMKDAVGLAVEGIKAAGENVWKVSLRGRRQGEVQKVELVIPQPLTRQFWFWALCALLAVSLAFGGWRFVVAQRLQRDRVLALERARIARDLHDDLGSSLMNIAYLGDSVSSRPGLAPDVLRDIDRVRTESRDLRRALDETVWAVDPEQDTLESLAGYLINVAQELLSRAGIRCRFDFPVVLPAQPVTGDMRHHIFLAFKETVLNVIRHARATEVNIRLAVEQQAYLLVIRDNGCGFDPEGGDGRQGGGHGVANIRKRMAAIGGRCEIVSRPGAGTEVRFLWRLQT
ncbi:MAG: ATP-binding protein [bacterium]